MWRDKVSEAGIVTQREATMDLPTMWRKENHLLLDGGCPQNWNCGKCNHNLGRWGGLVYSKNKTKLQSSTPRLIYKPVIKTQWNYLQRACDVLVLEDLALRTGRLFSHGRSLILLNQNESEKPFSPPRICNRLPNTEVWLSWSAT